MQNFKNIHRVIWRSAALALSGCIPKGTVAGRPVIKSEIAPLKAFLKK